MILNTVGTLNNKNSFKYKKNYNLFQDFNTCILNENTVYLI